MHIPAGLAYGALTSLSPVNGLYTSFYCSLVYVFFGTSRHLSVGTYAVTSLMVFSSISRLEEKYLIELKLTRNESSIDSMTVNETLLFDTSAEDLESVKLRIATALAFWCGMFQVFILFYFKMLKLFVNEKKQTKKILFCCLHLGSISKYLSQPLLRGFTTGCSFHVFTSQIRHLIGVYNPKRVSRRVFKIIYVSQIKI